MKKTTMFTLLVLIIALLAQFACAEPAAVVQGVFDALTKEDSDYNQTKAMYAEYFEDMQWEETVEGDSIVISIANSDYMDMDGSWIFTQEGDYLTTTFDGENHTGLFFAMTMLKAVGDYLGMETDVMSGYVNGLNFLGIESDSFVMEQDEAAGTMTVRINDAAPWDMKELDEMVLDETIVEPPEEGYTSTAVNFGKLMMVANVEGEGMTILLGEHGGLDELGYQSIINVVSILKPTGWEDFAANYAELADAQTDAYTVKLNADAEEISEIIYDAKDSYSYAILRFGTPSEGEVETEVEVEADDELAIDTRIEDGRFIIRIPDPEGDLGWIADDMAQDDSIVKLNGADLIEDTFVVEYEPVGDGDVTVGVRHYTGIACDRVYTWDLYVEGGAVQEETGWSRTEAPDEAYLDSVLLGEWLDKDTLQTSLTIEKNPAGVWDVEVSMPLNDGATIFKTTIYYDCNVNGMIYDKGKFWEVPTTDSGEAAELGEAKIAGATGCFYLGWDSEDALIWQDDEHPEDAVSFVRADGTQENEFTSPAPAEAPTVEALAEGYFNVLANLESDAAGASLKTAVAASEVCAFAESYELYNPDVESLRANMLAAFEGLSGDEQAAFMTNFDTVRALLDDCLEDYDANRAIFEDAGVVEAMDEVMYDPLNRLAWENLRDHTLTMGNDENVG